MSNTIEREPQSVCGFTGEDYAQVLADLLPLGVVWPREPETALMRTITGLAEEFARVHERDCDLLCESYPPCATETIPDWERICGLPDDCTGPLETLQERREAIMATLAARGGQSRDYFIALAAALGFDITITEFRPFLMGQGRAGDPVYNASSGRPSTTAERARDWWFAWEVNSATQKVIYFRAGESCAGDPLARWGNELLECAILAAKPAHTHVIFTYAVNP